MIIIFKNNEKVEKILVENKSSFSKAAGAVSQAVGGVLGRVSWFKTDEQHSHNENLPQHPPKLT